MPKHDSGESTRSPRRGQVTESQKPTVPPLLCSQSTWFWTAALVTRAWGPLVPPLGQHSTQGQGCWVARCPPSNNGFPI